MYDSECASTYNYTSLPIKIRLERATAPDVHRPAVKGAAEHEAVGEIHRDWRHAKFAQELDGGDLFRVDNDALLVDAQCVHRQPVRAVQVV